MMKKLSMALLLTAGVFCAAYADTLSVDKSDFAEISTVIDDAAYDIRYYSSNNFTGKRLTSSPR